MQYLKTPKYFLPLALLILFSSQAMTQTSKSSSQKKQEVITPIKSKDKTDPNYERNLAISKGYVPFVRKEHIEPVKNKAYYQKLIQELKTDIAKRDKTVNPNDDIATGKIMRIKDNLFLAEENLKKITQEN
jgi:hypothetical protein